MAQGVFIKRGGVLVPAATVPGNRGPKGDKGDQGPVGPPGGVQVLDDLTDVDFTTPPQHGDTLVYDGALGAYVPGVATSGDTAWRVIGTTGQPAYQNGWASYDYSATNTATYRPAAFRKDASGFVHLQGLVKSGSLNVAIFTLPVGYRPSGHLLFGTISNGGVGRVDIQANGEVQALSPSGNPWVALDGLHFMAEA